jgi:hypothetical protein
MGERAPANFWADAFDQSNGRSRVDTVETGRLDRTRPGTTQGHARQRKMERAMGIEPARAAPPELENKQFASMANPKCDGRVNFRGVWGHVGMHRRAKSGVRAYQA